MPRPLIQSGHYAVWGETHQTQTEMAAVVCDCLNWMIHAGLKGVVVVSIPSLSGPQSRYPMLTEGRWRTLHLLSDLNKSQEVLNKTAFNLDL